MTRSYVKSMGQQGFSLTEVLVSLVVMVPLMAAVLSLFTVASSQHSSEQSNVEASLEVRAGLEMMTAEIAQAGSHHDAHTTTSAAITATGPGSVAVGSTSGFAVGDWVDVDSGGTSEKVQLTAVGDTTLSGHFRVTHASGIPVTLYALPFLDGVIAPAGLGANSSTTSTTLKLYGDLNGDGQICYIEYAYDRPNNQITRSMTPVTAANKSAALPLISNVRTDTVQFTLYTDKTATVTAANVAFTVRAPVKNGAAYEDISLSSRAVAPSIAAASNLLDELQIYGGVNYFPPTPPKVLIWANQ